MTQTPQTRPDTSKGRFSLEQMRQMMLAEFERSVRHRYPVVCLVIAVDDFADLIQVYGEGRKGEIMRAGFNLLRKESQRWGLQGFGCWTKDRLLAVLPHTNKKAASELAQKIVEGARDLSFERDGHCHFVTFSIGVSRNLHEDTMSLEGLIRAAERGLRMASDAGGDRFVHWSEVETELDKIRTELGEQMERMRQDTKDLAARTADEAEVEQTEQERDLIAELRTIFAEEGKKIEGLKPLERRVVALVELGLRENRQRALEAHVAEHTMQVEMLERRISKLNKSLGTTADALKRVSAMKAVDGGIASIYRDVQGLSEEDAQAELKKELMADIFKANVALKKDIESSKAANA